MRDKLVKLDDGRTVVFTGKAKMRKAVLKGRMGYFVRLDFANGKTRLYPIDPDDVWTYAAHGARALYEAATMSITDIDAKVAAVDALADRLARRQWKQPKGRKPAGNGATLPA